MTSAREEAWRADALCAEVGPELFHPVKGASSTDAKRICDACDVRLQCLEYAIANNEREGVWGGTSERERVRIINARAAQAELERKEAS